MSHKIPPSERLIRVRNKSETIMAGVRNIMLTLVRSGLPMGHNKGELTGRLISVSVITALSFLYAISFWKK